MRRILLSALALLAAGVALPALAQPQAPAPTTPVTGAFLNITPKRLTFDRNRRNGTLFILNQGTEPVTVDVTVADRVMLEDGQIFAAEDAAKREDGKASAAALKSAKAVLQISPRRVTLQPGRPQTVRIRVSGTPEGGGEHRSHLTVTTIPPRDAGTTPEAAAAGAQNQLSFQIIAVYGLSVPLIIRSGDIDVRAAIEGAKLEYAEVGGKRTPVVAFDLVRQGENSAYGNFEVRPAGERRGDPLGVVRGVAVYPEIARRAVRIPLSRAPRAGEALEVTFTDDDTSPGRVLAKAAL